VSYDIQVYAERSLASDELRQLVADAGLGLVEDGDRSSLSVVRGVSSRYCFTLGQAVAIEAEDVPEEITAAMLEPSYMYELLVEGSSATEVPHAVRFARRLAEATNGVLLDQQIGKTWHRGQLRHCAPVQRGTIDIVDIRWYVRASASGPDAAAAWLELAATLLPEALPRRFGTYEPLALKLDRDGPEAFVQVVATEADSVFFKAAKPCIEGHLAGGDPSPKAFVTSHSLCLHREPLNHPSWQRALRRLFVAYAERTGSFFASAEVVRGLEWSGRSLAYGQTAERTTYLARGRTWAGLLPYPAWWTWFGPDYVSLVEEHLPPDQIQRVNQGLFHARGAGPVDRGQLNRAALALEPDGKRRGLSTLFARADKRSPKPEPSPWLPAELLAMPDRTDPALYSPPLHEASVIPPRLRAG
jgi:hypothetical protein